ncbi:MAG: hypothetical protein ACOY46_05555 [Bacillota bacterium]
MKKSIAILIIIIITGLALAGCAQKEDPSQATPVDSPASTETFTESSTPPEDTAPAAAPAPTDQSLQKASRITTLNSLPELIASEKIYIKGKTRPGYKVFIEGQEVPLNMSGEFNFPYSLQVGKNQLEVVTLGKEKIEESSTINIERRPAPPTLTVVPPDYSDSEFLSITGQTEKNCIVYVNSTPAKPDREGRFNTAVQLKEGENTIKITSTNSDGGTAVVEKNVRFTPPEPKLEVIIPDTANSKQVTISGITDTNTVLVLYVNEAKTNINQQNGIFSGTITLEEGVNKITVTAINKWGKRTTVSDSIFLYTTL